MTAAPPGAIPPGAVPPGAAPRVSGRGLLLAIALLAALHLGAGQLAHIGPGLQQSFGLSLNAGLALALALLSTRRQLAVLLAAVVATSALVRLLTEPPALALAVALAAGPALLVFRGLASRWSAEGRPESRRSLLALLGAGTAAVAVNLLLTVALVGLALATGHLAEVPGARLLVARPLAQLGGLVTVTPLVLLLLRRRPGGWPWPVRAELGGWLALLLAVAAVGVGVRSPFSPDPLLLLGAFAGLVLAVLRRGGPAAAVLTPAFAVTAAVVMLEPGGQQAPAGPGPSPALVLAQLAGLVAGLLAWAAAAVVAERDEGLRLAESEAAAQQALTALQSALLPPRVTSQRGVTVASRYRAAGSFDLIGGDWYDTVPLPTGGLGLVIGDVEGHDLTAASVMGLVRGAVRSFALEGHPPSVLLGRVGAFLASAGTDRLVTMAFVQLHPDDLTATLALAGHPAPVVVPGEGPVQVLEHARGPVLGVEGLTGWTEHTVRLPRGACLVLHTDGLVDAPSAVHGSRPGVAELLDGVPRDDVDDIADRLIGAAPAYDDAAVLVARLTSQGAPVARRTLPAQASSAGIARTWLRDMLAVWRSCGVVPPCTDAEAAELLVTELMSNAVRHSDRWVTVRLLVDGGRLRLEVEDSSERMPLVRRAEEDAADGRGLHLVEALSDDWGVDVVERGKVVWCELETGRRGLTPASRGGMASDAEGS